MCFLNFESDYYPKPSIDTRGGYSDASCLSVCIHDNSRKTQLIDFKSCPVFLVNLSPAGIEFQQYPLTIDRVIQLKLISKRLESKSHWLHAAGFSYSDVQNTVQ